MAQRVSYWENNAVFEEGPFVMVEANGWRIEAQVGDSGCPRMPHLSIYHLLRRYGIDDQKCYDPKPVERAVDWLNDRVKKGLIVKDGAVWVDAELATRA